MIKYVFVQNRKTILLGPFFWSKYRTFQSECDELFENGDLSTEFKIPSEEQGYINIGEGFEIFPLTESTGTVHLDMFEEPVGPYYSFVGKEAKESYSAKELPIESVRINLKKVVSAERYNRENLRTTIYVGNSSISVGTDRNARIYYSSLLTGIGDSPINYKSSNGFISLTGEDLKTIVDGIYSYVQEQFNWEKSMSELIDSTDSVEGLKSVLTTIRPITPPTPFTIPNIPVEPQEGI
jgi:hypothetical protein